ncbi:18S rRNA biogenesis protein RCL1 [Balamuthia mandrillaris]
MSFLGGEEAVLTYQGARSFRQRIVCAALSGKTVKIKEIRAADENPGLRDYEVSFLKLIENITNGSLIKINVTGTSVTFKPGVLVGGEVSHDCGRERAIGYFLEPLVFLAPFGKKALFARLSGITNDELDLSVDTFRTVTLPFLARFGLEEDLELKIVGRGAPPEGGGAVEFRCPIIKELKPCRLLEPGKVKRIRGVAYSTRVSPQLSNRVVERAKDLLTRFTPNVFIYTDHYKGKDSGASSGYALCLVAETTTGCVISAETIAQPRELPEDVAERGTRRLLEEILYGGCVDTATQPFALLFMVLCPEDVSKLRIGKLSPYSIQMLRHLKDFFGVTFKVEPDAETKTIKMTCLGSGFKNLARKIS